MDTFTYISPVLEAFHQVEDILAVQVVASLAVLEEASLVDLEAPSPVGLVVPFLVVGTQHLQVGDILAEAEELHLIIHKLIYIWERPVFCFVLMLYVPVNNFSSSCLPLNRRLSVLLKDTIQ